MDGDGQNNKIRTGNFREIRQLEERQSAASQETGPAIDALPWGESRTRKSTW